MRILFEDCCARAGKPAARGADTARTRAIPTSLCAVGRQGSGSVQTALWQGATARLRLPGH